MFIEKLELTSDIDIIQSESKALIDAYGWGHTNQLCLTHKNDAEDVWHDASGSLYNYEDNTFKFLETDFNNWNIDTNYYIRSQIELLQSQHNFELGRIRIMRLMPKTGLSVHTDREVRFHFVIKTNRQSYIVKNMMAPPDHEKIQAVCFHIPQDSHWYKVDTTKRHWAYNGGHEERIHLVVTGSLR
jgi:hypothetical protein